MNLGELCEAGLRTVKLFAVEAKCVRYEKSLRKNGGLIFTKKQFKIDILFLHKYMVNLRDSHPHEAKGHSTVQGIYQEHKNSLNFSSIASEKEEEILEAMYLHVSYPYLINRIWKKDLPLKLPEASPVLDRPFV